MRVKLTNRKSILAAQVPISSTKRQASNAGVVHCSTNGGKAMLCSSNIDIFPDASAFSGDGFGFWVDSDGTHLGEVDYDAVFDGRRA